MPAHSEVIIAAPRGQAPSQRIALFKMMYRIVRFHNAVLSQELSGALLAGSVTRHVAPYSVT